MLGAERAKARSVTSIRVGSSAWLGFIFFSGPIGYETYGLNSKRGLMDLEKLNFSQANCKGKSETAWIFNATPPMDSARSRMRTTYRSRSSGDLMRRSGDLYISHQIYNFDACVWKSRRARRVAMENIIGNGSTCLTSKVSREHGWRISCSSEHEM